MKRFIKFFIILLISNPAFSQIKVLNNGKVGIGTLMPKEKLQIGNWFTFHDGGSKAISCNFYYDGYNKRINTGYAQAIYMGGNGLCFRVAANGSANSIINWKTLMNIYENNVSINSTYSNGYYKLYVYGNFRAYGEVTCRDGFWASSDINLKSNIKPITNALKMVQKLEGKTYTFKESASKSTGSEYNYGLIAQDVEKVIPELVAEIKDSITTLGVNYDGFIPILIEAIKEQQIIIDKLKIDIENLKLGSVTNNHSSFENSVNKLYQNSPNPFNQETLIKYFVSSPSNNAMINIYDMQGIQIKTYKIIQSGEGRIIINGMDLQSGMYMYSLIVDNKLIDTKTLILTD